MSALSEKALRALIANGLDARKPANHMGECKAPYLVVQDGGEAPTGPTTCRRSVVLYAYAPYASPGQLAPLMDSARGAMRAVPALREAGRASEETIDDAYKAITANLTYTALCAR